MNRIDFVGNALFIPFFLIGVGMLVDFSVLFKGFGAIKVAAVMIVLAIIGKYIAALLTQKTFKLSGNERQMIFGLSNARVGATLAVVLVGYNVILGETATGEPIRLLNEDVLNGAILMILVTCTISSFVVEKTSRNIALLENAKPDAPGEETEKILISLAYPETVNELVDLALLLMPHKRKSPIYALHVVDERELSGNDRSSGKKMLEKAIKHAAATDSSVIPLARFDVNIGNGIIYTIKEHKITDVVIGLHHLAQESDHFFGPVAESILKQTKETIFIFKTVQPLNTLNRIIVAVPPNAEYEQGFHHWFERIRTIAKETGLPLNVYGNDNTIKILEKTNAESSFPLMVTFTCFDNWDDFLIFSREVRPDDLFIIIFSRKGYLSYIPQIDKLPGYLVKYFEQNSYIVLYPQQVEDYSNADLKPVEEGIELMNKAGSYVKKIFT